MKERKWKPTMKRTRRRTRQENKKSLNKFTISKPIKWSKHKTLIPNRLKHQLMTKTGIVCHPGKSSWENSKKKRASPKVPKNNKNKIKQSSLDNPSIIKLIKKLLTLSTDPVSEIDLSLLNNRKNTWRYKRTKKFPVFWTVMKKVMMKTKKIHS